MNQNNDIFLGGHVAIAGMRLPGPAPRVPADPLMNILQGFPLSMMPAVTPYERSVHLTEVIDSSLKEFLALMEAKRELALKAFAPVTLMGLLLDESNSMGSIKDIAVEGYNANCEQIRMLAKESPTPTEICLTKFSAHVEVSKALIAADALRPMRPDEYVLKGGTALYDAIAMTIERLLAHPAVWHPKSGILVNIVTDGQELHSQHFGSDVLSNLIEKLEATGNWTFAMMGTGDAATLAQTLKMRPTNVTTFRPDSREDAARAFTSVVQANSMYMDSRVVGATNVAGLYAGK